MPPQGDRHNVQMRLELEHPTTRNRVWQKYGRFNKWIKIGNLLAERRSVQVVACFVEILDFDHLLCSAWPSVNTPNYALLKPDEGFL
jgi:hypothetical protein